ncbi:hypothetical protein [Microbacterium binotii]|uniref:Uncharacterized protein n=1 Tax=Microbacterium binotii TaxID=462710 RepID=A0ABN3P7W5_9MICO
MNPQRDAGIPVGRIVAGLLPFIGVLGDFRPHPDPARPVTDFAQRAYESRVSASWSRWVGLVLTLLILGLAATTNPRLAPLAVICWLLLVNRLVWREGANPSPHQALAHSHLVWWTLSFSLVAVFASLADLVFPGPWWAGTATVTAVVSLLLALGGAFPTAKAVIAAQAPAPFDDTDYRLVAGVMKMTPTAYERSIADGSFTVQRDALGRIVAQIPPGSDAPLENIAELEERVRVKAPDWMVGYADPVSDTLILEPVDDDTRAQRDARARSGGLFAEHIGGLDDREVIDLSQGLGDQSLPRLG